MMGLQMRIILVIILLIQLLDSGTGMLMSANRLIIKAANKYHHTVGLLVAVHLLILSLTGLILLYKIESTEIKQHDVVIDKKNFVDVYSKIHAQLLSKYPKDKPLDIYPDENNSQITYARLGINGVSSVRRALIVGFDSMSGQEIQKRHESTNAFYDWILTLHYQLFLGQKGQIYLGIVGVAFILMNLSGLVMFLKKRRISPKYSYLHQYLALTCLVWGIVVGTTGALLALNPVFTKQFQQHTLKPLADKYQRMPLAKQPPASLKSVINTAFNKKPDGVIWYIIFPGMERGIENHYLVLMHGNGMLNQYFSEYLIIDAKTAELKEVVKLPLTMQLVFMATPFHFVSYGGTLIRILWALFAITTFIFACLGLFTFYHKKRIKYAKK